jgi:ABC-2 type transport system permease protein
MANLEMGKPVRSGSRRMTMFKEIRESVSLAFYLLRFTAKGQFEYPLWLVSFIVSIPIRCVGGIVFLYALVQQFESISGWSFYHLLFLYSLSYISEGAAFALAAQAWRIDLYLDRGDFDRMLVRPAGVLFQFFFKYLNLIGVVDVVVALGILGYAMAKLNMIMLPMVVVKMLLVVIGATLIRIAFLTILGSISFWSQRSSPVVGLGSEIMNKTTVYPITIYPRAVQFVLTFVLPFGFIGFYPASSLFGYSHQFDFLTVNAAFVTLGIGIAAFTLCSVIFSQGMNRYESSGS